jgi:hypothetical protein
VRFHRWAAIDGWTRANGRCSYAFAGVGVGFRDRSTKIGSKRVPGWKIIGVFWVADARDLPVRARNSSGAGVTACLLCFVELSCDFHCITLSDTILDQISYDVAHFNSPRSSSLFGVGAKSCPPGVGVK